MNNVEFILSGQDARNIPKVLSPSCEIQPSKFIFMVMISYSLVGSRLEKQYPVLWLELKSVVRFEALMLCYINHICVL